MTGGGEARPSVLVVDDEPAMRQTLEALLAGDFAVAVAHDVPEAERKLERTRFDVVLTDYEMPHGSGMTLLKLLKDRFPETVGILITGNGDYPEVRNAQAAWRDFRVVIKPFDPEALMKMVHNAAIFARLRRATTKLSPPRT
jgi:DNA-binding NtrC family response regulator